MKINTEYVPVKEIKNEDRTPKKPSKSENTGKGEDLVTLSTDKTLLVMDENRSASDVQLMDYKKAEEEILNLKSRIQDDEYTAAEIHQINEKRVLFLSLDVQ